MKPIIKYVTVSVSLFIVVVLGALKKPSIAFAATDGALSATSNGTSTVQLVVNELVQVNNIIDLNLDNGDGSNQYVPGGGAVSSTEQFCVHYNNAPGVDLTLTSTNSGGGGYILNDIGGNNVGYSVSVDEGDIGVFVAHADGATIQYLNMADPLINCAGGLFNSIRVTVADTGSPLGVPNGTYSDILNILIAPNP